ncbi:DNA polymerase delta subunit 4 [Eudromia elegans]
MGRKRLITDSFPVLRRPPRRREDKGRRGSRCRITRLQRWERAQALGLRPPAPVRDALLQHPDDPAVTYSLWHEYPL